MFSFATNLIATFILWATKSILVWQLLFHFKIYFTLDPFEKKKMFSACGRLMNICMTSYVVLRKIIWCFWNAVLNQRKQCRWCCTIMQRNVQKAQLGRSVTVWKYPHWIDFSFDIFWCDTISFLLPMQDETCTSWLVHFHLALSQEQPLHNFAHRDSIFASLHSSSM